MRHSRVAVLAVTMAFLGSLSTAATGSVAQADDPATLVACPLGTQAIRFDPGLTLVPRHTTVHVDGVLGPCVSAANPHINNATFTVDGSGTALCLTANFRTSMVVDWNSGPDSIVDLDLNVSLRPAGENVVVTTGRVVSGQFAGAQIIRVTAELTVDFLGCLTHEGVTAAAGPSAMLVVG